MSHEDVTVRFDLAALKLWLLLSLQAYNALGNATTEEEAYEMMRGVGAVMRGLAEEGIAPR
jgi:hypothetical protein